MKRRVGRPSRFNEEHKIVKKVSENPRRKGTKAHNNFKLFKNGMRITTYRTKGGNMRDLRYSVDKGWIEVVDV